MIKRGFIINIPQRIDGVWQFSAWILWIIHRYHFPSILFVTLLGVLLSFFFCNWKFMFLMITFIETLYLSIGVHETFHMAYGMFIGGKNFPKSISIIPYTLEVRTNFDPKRKLAPEDLYVITFAGPVFSLLISFISIIIIKLFNLPRWLYIYIIIFSLINILSLLPFSDTDGKRVFGFIKQNPHFLKNLLLSLPYFFVLSFKRFKEVRGI
ncbi:hypothetical protein DRN58_01795 [Thermococci archaeon]|nr:MAG: hypothetical protein DRN58_01795 [Thermococci archaeon]